MPLQMKNKKKTMGLYGKPHDFLNRIRVPGMEAATMHEEQEKTLDTDFTLDADGVSKKRRRRMDGGFQTG